MCLVIISFAHLQFSSLAAPSLFLFLLRFLFSQGLPRQFHCTRIVRSSKVGVRVEVGEASAHVQSSSHVHSFLRLLLLLILLMIDDALRKNTEYFVYTLSGLRTRSEMLAAHTHCISKLALYTSSLLPLRFINWYLSIWDVAFISSYDDWSVLR